MNFTEYSKLSAATAIYSPGRKIIYPALGLAGEAGEVCNKVKKITRDDEGVITKERRNQILEEIGGVLWYAAALCRDLEVSLNRRWLEALPKYLPSLDGSALRLAGAAGKIADYVDYNTMHPGMIDLRERLPEFLNSVVKYSNCVLYHVESTLGQAMEMNLNILSNRKDRGTLKGDGDNR